MRQLAILTVLGLGLFTLIGCDQKPETTAPAKTESVPAVAPATGPSSAAPGEAAGEVAAAPTNVKCPVSGDPVNPKDASLDRVVYKGKTYVFCCNDCKAIFNKDPEKAIASLSGGKPMDSGMNMGK